MGIFVAKENNERTVKPSRIFSDYLTIFTYLAVAICVILVVIIVAIKSIPKQAASIWVPDFCCVEEALDVAQRLNTSFDPCANFYDFVCTRRAAGMDSMNISPLFHMAEYRARLTDSAGSSDSPSGRAFADLSRSCKQQDWRFEVAFADFMATIVSASEITASMSAADIVRFLALMSFRYRLPGFVTFRPIYTGNDTVTTSLELRRWNWIDWMLNSSCFECVESMTTSLNTLLKVNLDANALMEFHYEVLSDERTTYGLTKRSLYKSPFSSVGPNEWEDILNEFVHPIFPDAEYIFQEAETELNDLIFRLARPSNQPLAVAYLITQTVMAVYQEFVDFGEFKNRLRMGPCTSFVLKVYELEESYEAQVTSTPARDHHVHVIFDDVRKQVGSDAVSSSTFSGKDHLRINETLGSLQLLLPKDVAIAHKPPPKIIFNFPADLLAVRSFGFQVQQEKVRKKVNNVKLKSYTPDVFRRDNVIAIPASVYLMLNFEREYKLFTNLAIVGARLAREIWSFLLEVPGWTNETMQNIQFFQLCFNSPGFCKAGAYNATSKAHLMAAAISSILKAVNKSRWLHVHNISNFVRMSRGQLFYLVLADNLCGDVISESCAEDINVPIKNTPDFSVVFHCAPDAAMSSGKSLCRV